VFEDGKERFRGGEWLRKRVFLQGKNTTLSKTKRGPSGKREEDTRGDRPVSQGKQERREGG